MKQRFTHNLSRIAVVLASATLLIACGGGSDGDDTPTPTPTPTPVEATFSYQVFTAAKEEPTLVNAVLTGNFEGSFSMHFPGFEVLNHSSSNGGRDVVWSNSFGGRAFNDTNVFNVLAACSATNSESGVVALRAPVTTLALEDLRSTSFTGYDCSIQNGLNGMEGLETLTINNDLSLYAESPFGKDSLNAAQTSALFSVGGYAMASGHNIKFRAFSVEGKKVLISQDNENGRKSGMLYVQK